jgi:hypothetical protein
MWCRIFVGLCLCACVRVCLCRCIMSCGCKHLPYLDPCFCGVVASTLKFKCVLSYLNFFMYIHIGLCVRIYLFFDMSPEILSNPKETFISGFLISDCIKFRDGWSRLLEYCVILYKRLKTMAVWYVKTPSVVSYNVKTLRPPKHVRLSRYGCYHVFTTPWPRGN